MPLDISKLTVKEAAAILADKAIAARAAGIIKVAIGEQLQPYLSQLGDAAKGYWDKAGPIAQRGLEGAAVGGLGGLALGALSPDDEGNRHPWSSALTGLMAGGAAGAGGQALYDNLTKAQDPNYIRDAAGNLRSPGDVEAAQALADKNSLSGRASTAAGNVKDKLSSGISALVNRLGISTSLPTGNGGAAQPPGLIRQEMAQHPDITTGAEYAAPWAASGANLAARKLRQFTARPSNVNDPKVFRNALGNLDPKNNLYNLTAAQRGSLGGVSDDAARALTTAVRNKGVLRNSDLPGSTAAEVNSILGAPTVSSNKFIYPNEANIGDLSSGNINKLIGDSMKDMAPEGQVPMSRWQNMLGGEETDVGFGRRRMGGIGTTASIALPILGNLMTLIANNGATPQDTAAFQQQHGNPADYKPLVH